MINSIDAEKSISNILRGPNWKMNLLIPIVILASMITVIMTTKSKYDFDVDVILENNDVPGEIKTLRRNWTIDQLRTFLSKGGEDKRSQLYKGNDGDVDYQSPPNPPPTEICKDPDATNAAKNIDGEDPSDPNNVSGVYTFCKYSPMCNNSGAMTDEEQQLLDLRRNRVNQDQWDELVPVSEDKCNWCDTTSDVPSNVNVNSASDVINWVNDGCPPDGRRRRAPGAEPFTNTYKDEYTIKQEIWGNPKSNKMFELHRLLSLISIILIVYIIRNFMKYQNEKLGIFTRPIALQKTTDRVVIFLTILLLIDYNSFLTNPKKTSLSIWRFTLLMAIISTYFITYKSKSTIPWTTIIQNKWLAHYIVPLVFLSIFVILWFFIPGSDTFKNPETPENEENTEPKDLKIQDIIDNFV